MDTLELVEKLRARANISFEEARDALNACNGDLLDALIMLERQGKTSAPSGGGYYSSEPSSIATCPEQERGKRDREHRHYHHHSDGEGWRKFKEFMSEVGRFILKVIDMGNRNLIEISRLGKVVFSIPVSVFVLLLIFMFWSVLPLMVISLFFKVRYHFRGAEFGKDSVNNVMDGFANAADAAADSVRNSYKEHQASANAEPQSEQSENNETADE
ncbi:MAG: ubiquitin [Oscillospiraceae bacterium]|nr:ubiquitin [Oscillospiraceae bacterium]